MSFNTKIKMKQLLFSNWHFMRYLRFAFAVFLFYNAFETQEWFFIVFGIFFLFQAVFNFGCGSNGCRLPIEKKQ
jgi:VanZ family protein